MWEKDKLLVTNLSLSQTIPCFYVTSKFSFSHSVFHPFGEHSAIFIKFEIVVCKLFQFVTV